MKNIGSIYHLGLILGRNDLKLASSSILLPPQSPQTSRKQVEGITLTPTFTMKEVPTEHLLVLSKLANLYYEQGHKDEASALCNQIIELCYPHILEQAKSDKRYIYELIKQKNCKDEKLSYEAKIILQFLKNKGLQI